MLWEGKGLFGGKWFFMKGEMKMAQIRVDHLTFSYEGSSDPVFEDVSFVLDTDWKLGFVGRNGKGKTTFLRLLLGQYEYRGKIQASAVFDYFPYRIGENHLDQMAAEFLEELKAGCELWRVLVELEKLQAGAEILYRPFGSLSPGERTKILLAVFFSGENDFLLIDEPTNHLDEAARECVKEYLASKKGFILVSHDRELLDACIDHVLVLNRCSIQVESGNFSGWWENKSRRDHFQRGENEKHKKEISKLRQAARQTAGWADKVEHTKIGFYPGTQHDRPTRAYIGGQTKKMQSRVKSFEKRIEKEIREKEGLLADLEEDIDLKMMPLAHHKERLVDIREYGVQYAGARQPVFEGLTAAVFRGDRVALHGPNGCGKSTLLKMLLQKGGVLEESLPVQETGVCETASGLVISYVGQGTSFLKGGLSEFCRKRGLEEHLFFAVLRQLDFEREQFGRPLETCSEGQKKKALLAASLLTPAHLYVWDEPLNYIDVFSRMQIEKVLLENGPSMVFVEHDKRFRERVATKVLEMGRI